jgi:hypothetical protein
VVYGPTSVLPGRGHIYSGRFGGAPFQHLYGEQDFFNPLAVLILIPVLCLLALFNPYLLALPAVGLAALATVYLRHGTQIARREKLHPVWRSGAVIGLLHLMPLVARLWGRLRTRNLPVPEGRGTCWPLRSAGHRLFLTEGVEDIGRDAFLEGLRDRLRDAPLRPEPPSEWDEADITCNSPLFWRARMVSYEGWGAFYLRLSSSLRPARLLVPVLGTILLGLWSPVAGAGALAGLLTVLLFEGWLFARRVRLILVTDPRERSHGER